MSRLRGTTRRQNPGNMGRPMQPRVSVVVNNFNYARYLPQCIDSALSQTYPATEVVVVDDASSDDSREVIRRYRGRVEPVLQERNGGQGAAFNAGFRASHGDILVFLDSDDYLYPDAIESVARAWTPGASKVQYRLDLVDADGRWIDLYPPPEVSFESGDVVPRLLSAGRYETSVTSGNAFSRTALERILPMPEGEFRLAADGYLVTLAPLFGPVISIERALGAYRQHGHNAWGLDPGALAERLRRLLEHDEHKYRFLKVKAAELGLTVSRELGLGDHQHLATRLASLCLDPERHPYRGDSRTSLALRGAGSARGARLPFRRRAVVAAWFLALGFLPRPVASRAAAWRLAPASRSPRVARFLKGLRRLSR